MDMCRFSGTEDPEYQKVAAAIEQILQHLPMKLQPGLLRLNGTGSSHSADSCAPDISPQWGCTENANKVDNIDPVSKTSDRGQAEARQNLMDLLRFDTENCSGQNLPMVSPDT
jgi:hypothetical protein